MLLPDKLNIFLTESCNLKCAYCYINKETAVFQEAGVGSLIKGIDFFLRSKVRVKDITFTGGEPLLRFNRIKRLCQALFKKNLKHTKLNITVFNNGTLLDEKKIKFFKDCAINLKVSIDGSKNINDANRAFKNNKKKSSYALISKNIKKLNFKHWQDKGIKANLVFTKKTIRYLIENIKAIRKIGFKCIDFYPELYALWSDRELDALESAIKKFSRFYISLFKNAQYESDVFSNSLLASFIKKRESFKPVLCRNVNLSPDGKFYFCDKIFSLPKEKRLDYEIGNVRKGFDNGLRIKLLAQKLKEIYELTGVNCRDCDYLDYCFCPIGHYIYFDSYGLDFKRYLPCFCRITKIYAKEFLEPANVLISNPIFCKIYSLN